VRRLIWPALYLVGPALAFYAGWWLMARYLGVLEIEVTGAG
jgi:hypothetical protein